MTKTRIRQDGHIQSSEKVEEDLTVTDGYDAAQNDSTKSLQDDLNYLRTAIKDLKGVDDEEVSDDQKRFSSSHDGVAIVGDGYGKTVGLPEIDSEAPNSINHALHLLKLQTSGGGSSGASIGPAEDGSYEDGLFPDFVPSTEIGVPIDRFNEVLKELVPPEAPSLSDASMSDSGTTAKLSFGVSNAVGGYTNVGTAAGGAATDLNGTFSNSGDRKGIFNATTTINGVLAEAVVAHTYSYPANSFGSGDLGTLKLEVNGVVIHTTDLTSFGSGNSLTGSSGFNLSAATSVKFDSGSDFTLFKYRTGTWTIDPADQQNGWNYMKVTHTVNAVDSDTNYFEWVVDADTTTTTFSGEALDNLVMSGSKFISGVEYFTGGTADYDITVENVHLTSYSTSGSAISHPSSVNTSLSSTSLGNIAAETDTEVLTNASVTVDPDDSADRIIGGDISLNTRATRSIQAQQTSSGASGGYSILMDANSGTGGNTSDSFDEEGFRQKSDLSITSTSYGSGPSNGPSDWDETQDLTTGSAGHTDGLLISEGKLQYPTQGYASGDFSSITTPGAPAGNVDYSAASGDRVYLRYFYAATTHQNFTFNVTVSGTTFVTTGTGLSASNCHFELLAPNTTQDSGATIEWKDMVAAYTDDDSIGAYAASQGATIPTDWGSTIGTRSTNTSGNVIVIRITASSAWTGSISNISVTFN